MKAVKPNSTKAMSPKSVDNNAMEKDNDEIVAIPTDPDLVALEIIRENIRYIERSVTTKEVHFMSRAVRSIGGIRKKLNYNVLRRLVDNYYPNMAQKLNNFEIYDNATSDVNGNNMDVEPQKISPQKGLRHLKIASSLQMLPEVELFVHLLFLLYLLDNQFYNKAITCSDNLILRLGEHNRRMIYPLSAKCYYFFYRSYELANDLDMSKVYALRPLLLDRLRTSTLHNDSEGQAVLINLLLRNYLSERLFEQANMLVSKVNFPDSASNTEYARHHFYLGKIKAIRLEYSEANDHLQLALRKAPTNRRAIGFKQTTHKLHIIVQLLLGQLPDRSLFRLDYLSNSLAPYFELTQAVRIGNLAKFNEVLTKHSQRFLKDDAYNMIIRLRHNVIKTGVKRISLSYSKISLHDIAERLSLDNPDDVEFIVAKAIRDGVIDASIDHSKGCLITRDNIDIYATSEPYHQLNQRIQFCLNIRNQSVKAMRYPAKLENEEESPEERREREMNELENVKESPEERREREMNELENVKEMSEDDYDDF